HRPRRSPNKGAVTPSAFLTSPVGGRMPVLAIHSFPTFRKPPAKVLVSAVSNEVQKFPVTDRRFVDRKIFYENLVLWLLIIKRELPGGWCPGTALVPQQH